MKTTSFWSAAARRVLAVCMASCLAVCAGAQPASEVSSATESASRSGAQGGIPITQLIAMFSKSSGKKFALDPRVRADVNMVGINPSSLSYPQLLAILHLHGFVADEQVGIVLVVPDANARTLPSPLLTDRETKPDFEIVTDTLPLKNSPAALLVPILRPLLPQYAHLAADTCNNTLLIVDTFANVKRVEALVRRLDVGDYKPRPCELSPPREPPPQPREGPAVK